MQVADKIKDALADKIKKHDQDNKSGRPVADKIKDALADKIKRQKLVIKGKSRSA